jgi:CheY-like chemotaxis protein/anti-sigma regulatory factor (Ser/Thr protein kinase)
VHDAFAGAAAAKALDFALVIEPAAQGRYRGDFARIRQILFNLLSNAVKFTETGRIGLHVAREGDRLVLTVEDTGIGIPADRLPRLFNKFEQADASTTRRFGGTGLGLAICRDLTALMGGEIDIESEEGAGSRFRLRLDLPRLGDEAPGEAAAPADGAGLQDGAGLRVLAAEDNSVNSMVLRTLLQQIGLDPMIVGNGAEALAAWREHPWDVILMDVQMPVMDGPTATRRIRAEEAQSGRPRTPIVALTANAMSHQLDEYHAAGMDGLIAKPIRVEELFATLQAVLDGAPAEGAEAAA